MWFLDLLTVAFGVIFILSTDGRVTSKLTYLSLVELFTQGLDVSFYLLYLIQIENPIHRGFYNSGYHGSLLHSENKHVCSVL